MNQFWYTKTWRISQNKIYIPLSLISAEFPINYPWITLELSTLSEEGDQGPIGGSLFVSNDRLLDKIQYWLFARFLAVSYSVKHLIANVTTK